MRGFLTAAATAAALITGFALAPAGAADCKTVGEVRREVAKLAPAAAMTEMGRDETEGFLKAFNAAPPVSNETGDYALVIDDATRGQVAVVLFERGCATRTGLLARAAFRNLLRAL